MSYSSKIFVRHKALGYVTNHVPLVTRFIQRRNEVLIVTSVGRSFHTYGSKNLRLLSVSDLHPEDITCLAGNKYFVFSSAGNIIYAWTRGCQLKHKYIGHKHKVHFLLCFGDHFISVDVQSNLKVWSVTSEEVHLELKFDNDKFQITALMHPHTYLNKVLLGSEQGYLQLWNLKSSKLIYSFKGWGSGVSAIEQSPAIDIVGIGLKNGLIILHNLKYDEVVMEFRQTWGCVTSLTFRLDNVPVLITGTNRGHLVFWDLEKKIINSQMLNVHKGGITGLECFPSEPLMVSSSPDNSLRLWIFDLPDGGARLLRFREGHPYPPTYARFYGEDGHNLLTSGGDSSLRSFNTLTEIFNKSFGIATFKLKKVKKKKGPVLVRNKMPPIVAFSSENTREKEWDNIAAIHYGIPQITTWSYKKVTMGKKKLSHKRFVDFKSSKRPIVRASATSVFVTHCGNFVIAGYSSGHCDKFNLQSGLYRGSYGKKHAHQGAVRGVVVDILNLRVTTGGSDGYIRWWNFKTKDSKEAINTLLLDDGISFFTYHLESALLAVALENFEIILIDNEGQNIVRRFEDHCGKVNDLTFSPDSKWLISAGMDCSILTWDLPSGSLIDQFRIEAPCTSLSFSPTGEFLATTHVNYLGVFLWSNRTLFTHVALKPIVYDSDLPMISLPLSALKQSETVPDEEERKDEISELCDQIQDLVTLSSLSSSKWKNLLNLDIIKQRNKPKEPPKSLGIAPFFLPTIPSTDIKFDFSDVHKDSQIEKVSMGDFQSLTSFGRYLKDTETTKDYPGAFEKLKKMGPSSIDFEIQSLSFGLSDSTPLFRQFLEMIKHVLDSKVDFELAQSYLSLFLKTHGSAITDNDSLRTFLGELQPSQVDSWHTLQDNLLYNLSVIQALKMRF